MPELPEVEVIRRGLLPCVVGRRVHRAAIGASRLTRRLGTPRTVAQALAGRRIMALRRRGKYFLFELGENTLVIRLGMTGQLLWWESADGFRPDAYTHACLTFCEGGLLAYRDIRKFGELFVLPTAAVEPALRLGVEPLGPGFTPEALREICRTVRRIKPLLLDQTKVAGIGNIYADEALFRAGIRPTRRAASLRGAEIQALHRAIRKILQAGIRYRGSSVSTYRDAAGAPGRFARLHRVYQRQKEPCFTCGTPIRRVLLGQRGTHFCPTCQR